MKAHDRDESAGERGCAIASLHVYPIKSCRGIALESARVHPEGLENDRKWMLVDSRGRFVTQREHPALARVVVELADPVMRVSVYGHGSLRVPLGPSPGPRRQVTIWNDVLEAADCGDEAGEWFSDLLGKPVSLVRFPAGVERRCDPRWAPQQDARSRFSDGFPLLVVGQASVDDLAARMGVDTLAIERFRPNLVLSGTEAYEEDTLGILHCGEVALRLVKPCARCTIPSIDPERGTVGPLDPLAALMSYRFDTRVGGATFGVNAIVTAGAGGTIRRGLSVSAEPVFDADAD